MRYRYNEIAPSGHRQYLIALNVRELELLYGMASKLSSVLPERGPTQRIQQVAKNMAKTFSEAIMEADKLGDKGKRVHLYPSDNKSVV